MFGDYVCDFGSYADLGEAKSVCKDGLNFLECDIILELRERCKFFEKTLFHKSLKKLGSAAKFKFNIKIKHMEVRDTFLVRLRHRLGSKLRHNLCRKNLRFSLGECLDQSAAI